MSTVVEIEVTNDRNRNLYFEPIDRILRGEFDFNRCAEPTARLLTSKWPRPIPGVKLGIDTKTGEGFLVETLHEPEHEATREQVEKRGRRIATRREAFPNAHVASWLDRMKRAVNAGVARLVTGKFPEKLPGKPIQRFLTMDAESHGDKQDAILDRLGRALDKLADKLGDWDE